MTAYVHDVLRRAAAPRYTIVAVPETPLGDEILEAGWATGRGGTLSPVTPRRLQKLASGLLDGYFADDPFRTVIRDRRERWLGDGVRHLYAWRAVARAGLRQRGRHRAGAGDRLRRILRRGGRRVEPRARLRRRRGRAALGRDRRAVRDADARPRAAPRDGRPGGLDDLIAKLYAGRVARSLWSSLPNAGNARWKTYRDHYVRGEEPPVGDSSFALAATTIDPIPPRGAVTRQLSLAYTGSTYGYLENCGCKLSQAGGVARRETMIERIRREGGPVLVLDAGNAFVRPDRPEGPSALTREEQGLYLNVMRDLRYSAAAVGEAELAYGASYFRALSARAPVTFVAANVRAAGAPLAREWTRARVGDVRFGVIGLFEPERSSRTSEVFERHASDYAFEDPIAALTRVLPEARAQSDLVVAMGRLSPYTIRRLTAACPDVDIVISTSPRPPTVSRKRARSRCSRARTAPASWAARSSSTPASGATASAARARARRREAHRLGRLVRSLAGRHGVGGLAHTHDADPVLRSSRPHASGTGQRAAAVRARTGAAQRALRGRRTVLDVPPRGIRAVALDAARAGLAHAARRAPQLPAAVRVVPRGGLGHEVGLQAGGSEPEAGQRAVRDLPRPGRRARARAVTGEHHEGGSGRVCLECHNPDHSDHFVYEAYLPLVVHRPTGGAAAAEHSSAARP